MFDARIMIFIKAKIRQPHLFSLFLLAVISLTRAYGQESYAASFSLESNFLSVPVLEVQTLGFYRAELKLVENSRFKLTSAEQSDWATTENVYQTSTSTMILPKVAVLQGGVEIARYELHLLLEDLENLLFSVAYLNELTLPSSASREEICSDYGCFELQTKLTGPNSDLDQTVFHSTVPGTGFFVSDSLVLTTSKVLRTMEDAPSFIRLPGPSPQGADACQSYGEQLSKNGGNYILESGAGPVIQLFDGRWALGEVVWTDDATGLGALRIVAVTDNRKLPFVSWAPWDGPGDNQHWLSLRAADVYQIGETATVHHPDLARSEGGWFVSSNSALNCSINANSQLLYLNHYSDPGSNGAPVVDDTGSVIAIVEDQRSDSDGTLCPANKATTTKNSLGPLPRYYADSTSLTVGAPITSALINALKIIDPSINSNAAPRSEVRAKLNRYRQC